VTNVGKATASKITSSCPFFPGQSMSYKAGLKSTASSPCTNLPIACPEGKCVKQGVLIWPYNAGAHYSSAHGDLSVTESVVEAARLLHGGGAGSGNMVADVGGITARAAFVSHPAVKGVLQGIATERDAVLKAEPVQETAPAAFAYASALAREPEEETAEEAPRAEAAPPEAPAEEMAVDAAVEIAVEAAAGVVLAALAAPGELAPVEAPAEMAIETAVTAGEVLAAEVVGRNGAAASAGHRRVATDGAAAAAAAAGPSKKARF
jgi:hypothetical protein